MLKLHEETYQCQLLLTLTDFYDNKAARYKGKSTLYKYWRTIIFFKNNIA